MKHDIETALEFGRPVAWVGDPEFSRRVEGVRDAIAEVARDGDEARAAELLHDLLDGCFRKAPEIDDCLGRFTRFVERLAADWLRLQGEIEADPAETAVSVMEFLTHDEGDLLLRYRMWGPDAFDEDGEAALEMALRMGTDALEPDSDLRLRLIRIRKEIAARWCDVEEYEALCDAEGGVTPRDCEVLAKASRELEEYEDALAWIDRCLELEADDEEDWGEDSAWEPDRRRRTILAALGRGDEARDAALGAFQTRPSIALLDELDSYVEPSERKSWRHRALTSPTDAPLGDAMGVLLALGEKDLLAGLVGTVYWEDLFEVSQLVNRPTIEILLPRHPLLAARLHAAVGMRLLGKGKRAHYGRILENLGEARILFSAHGGWREWDSLVEMVLDRAGGKKTFLRRFADLTTRGGDSGRVIRPRFG